MKKNKIITDGLSSPQKSSNLSRRSETLSISMFHPKLLAGCLLLFVVTYLYAINQTAVQGFAVRGAEQSVARAKDENQKLRIEEAQLRSLGRIVEAKDQLGLVEVTPDNQSVNYLSLGESLALR